MPQNPRLGIARMHIGLFTQALGVNFLLGENDHHRAAADFTVVVYLGGHFIRVGDGDFKDFEAGRAGDFGKFHMRKVAPEMDFSNDGIRLLVMKISPVSG
jgi:hypothetical protein